MLSIIKFNFHSSFYVFCHLVCISACFLANFMFIYIDLDLIRKAHRFINVDIYIGSVLMQTEACILMNI